MLESPSELRAAQKPGGVSREEKPYEEANHTVCKSSLSRSAPFSGHFWKGLFHGLPEQKKGKERKKEKKKHKNQPRSPSCTPPRMPNEPAEESGGFVPRHYPGKPCSERRDGGKATAAAPGRAREPGAPSNAVTLAPSALSMVGQ